VVLISGQLKFESGILFHEAKNVWKFGRITNGRVSCSQKHRRNSTLSRPERPAADVNNEDILPRPCCSG
jgi:hypothetical protein